MGTPITIHLGEKLVMGVPLIVFGVTRCNWGDEDDSEWETVVDQKTGEESEKKTMYGSPVTNAFAQAFKRSCALFGMGLSMYDKGAAKAQPATQNTPAADPLDAPGHGKRANGKTWRELLADDEGRGYAKWCLEKISTLSPSTKAALTEALAPQKADAVHAVMLQDAVNRAASAGAITDEQERRVLDTIEKGDPDAMRIATDWLRTQMARLEGEKAGV